MGEQQRSLKNSNFGKYIVGLMPKLRLFQILFRSLWINNGIMQTSQQQKARSFQFWLWYIGLTKPGQLVLKLKMLILQADEFLPLEFVNLLPI